MEGICKKTLRHPECIGCLQLGDVSMEKYYWGALSATAGLSGKKLEELVNIFGSARETYLADRKKLLETGLYKEAAIEKFISQRDFDLPEHLYNFCTNQSVKLVSIKDGDYPVSLKNIVSPPNILYIKGDLPKLKHSIGIVGSRNASAYGLKAAKDFAFDLAAAQVTIVSGGAKGIDSAAHIGAIEAKGTTVAVLGCGIDVVYPRENQKLFEKIITNGALITEFPPTTPPLARNFPLRNRIVNGLTTGILVVEAAKKSGAMITAEYALDEGHDVYCVPGSIYLPNSIGCHSLIKNGAQLVDSPEDILNLLSLGWTSSKNNDEISLFERLNDFVDSSLTQQLLNILTQEPVTLEELVEKSGHNLAAISSELLNLQMQGRVAVIDGNKYYRI